MTDVKTFLWVVISGILGFLHPISDFMNAMILVFALNYVAGVTADIINGGKWSFKKSMYFFFHCFLFFVIAASIFIVGHYMHNPNSAIQCVSYITWAAIYFFTVNIIRNFLYVVKEHSAMHRFLDFLYYVVSLQAIEKIPLLKNYLNRNGKN